MSTNMYIYIVLFKSAYRPALVIMTVSFLQGTMACPCKFLQTIEPLNSAIGSPDVHQFNLNDLSRLLHIKSTLIRQLLRSCLIRVDLICLCVPLE